MTALSHSDYSFFFFLPPLFFLSFVSPLITAVGSGVGVQMGCRSTPLPFLSLTPSPLLLPTRLSDALTLPGNKLPVKPTCLRCHSIIYLSHCGICSNVGNDLQRLWLGKEKRWWWLAESGGGRQSLAHCLGKMQHISGKKKSGFFQTFPPCQVPERVYVSQLVSYAEHSCWALLAGTGCVMIARARSFSLAVRAAHKYFQTGKYSSVVISHLR